jgi:hypothetical protein
MPAVRKLYKDYQDRAAFYFVYIEEAHAHDVWPLVTNAKEGWKDRVQEPARALRVHAGGSGEQLETTARRRVVESAMDPSP